MPNRIIKESICTSPNLNLVSAEAERLFYRLIVKVDDYGRFDGRLEILRPLCFPLKIDTVTEAMIEEWLGELDEADLIRRYTAGGQAYIVFTTWRKHQQVRAKHSKFPEPTAVQLGLIDPPEDSVRADAGKREQPLADASERKQTTADDGICPRSRTRTRDRTRNTRSNSESRSKSKSTSKSKKKKETSRSATKKPAASKPRKRSEKQQRMDRLCKAYSTMKGVEPKGNEWLPIQKTFKLMLDDGRTEGEIVSCMKDISSAADSGVTWLSNWTVNTARRKIAEHLGGTLTFDEGGLTKKERTQRTAMEEIRESAAQNYAKLLEVMELEREAKAKTTERKRLKAQRERLEDVVLELESLHVAESPKSERTPDYHLFHVERKNRGLKMGGT